ncbi:MAG: hypothetical protein ACRDTD_09030, partial [Pseudonocardiaceae bacterium]
MDDYSTPANTTSHSLVNGGLCRIGIAGADALDYSPAAVVPALRGGWSGGDGGEDLGMSRMRVGDRICLACRVTALSRYNPDPLCSAYQRASRDTAGIVPSWLWDSEPMRAALARVDIPAVVAIFRAASGLSQMELD